MKLQIEALDPLFFRDGRPFSLGEESYAEGIFPPFPSTIRGCLRSLWISQRLSVPGADVKTLAKASDNVELTYLGLGIAGNPVYPVPFDLYLPAKNSPAAPMDLVDKATFASSCPSIVSHLFKPNTDGKIESVTGHLLDADKMEGYIRGDNLLNFETKRLSDFAIKEHKIGIGRENELHLTKEGLLFRLVANRFQDERNTELNILVEVAGFDTKNFPLSKFIVTPLGGERRSAAAKSSDFALPATPTIKGKFFKICLLTPALFDSWYPIHLSDEFSGLRLVAASIGKPDSVGGWDVLNQRPKPMRRAAPAGSVYLFEAKDEAQANEIAQKYHTKSICQSTDNIDGFGGCFIAQPFDNQKI